MDESSVCAELPAVIVADPSPPLRIPGYRVLRAIGRGPKGTVYLCQHDTLERQASIKVLDGVLSGTAASQPRFQADLQASAKLDHKNAVRVYDFGRTDDAALYIVREYFDGRDLARALVEDSAPSDARIVSIMSQLLLGLSAAHEIGLVHRDVKPSNILLVGSGDAERVLLGDFGLAQLAPLRLSSARGATATRRSPISNTATVIGTPAYMSPEQARGEVADARSDVYSAGVVLFQLLTRTLPFVAESTMSVAVMHCLTPPPPPSGYAPANPALEAICLKALSKTPEARFQSAAEMRAALEATLPRKSRTSSLAIARNSLAPAPKFQAQGSEPRGSLVPNERVVVEEATSRPQPRARNARAVGGALVALAACVLALVAVSRVPASQAVKPNANVDRAAASAPRGALEQSAPHAAPEPRAPHAAPERRMMDLRPSASPVATTVVSTALPAELASSMPSDAAESANVVAADAPSAERRPALALVATTRRSTRGAEVERGRSRHTPANIAQAYLSHAPTLLVAAASEAHAVEASTPAVAASSEPTVSLPPPAAEAAERRARVEVAPLPAEAPAATPAPASEPAPVAIPAAPAAPAPSVSARAATLQPTAARPTAGVSGAKASVAIAEITSRAVSKAGVRNALNQAGLTRCYRDALQAGGLPATALDAEVEFSTSMGGNVASATVHAPGLPRALRGCIEQVVRSGRVRGADTGAAQASVTLHLEPN